MQAHGFEQEPIPGMQPIHNQDAKNFRTEPLVYNYCMLDVSTQIYCPQTVTHNIANSTVYDEYDDFYVKISLL